MYIAAKAFVTTKWVELIKNKNFVARAFDPKDETFIVYVAFISRNSDIHLYSRAQISFLKIDKALNSISSKYVDFADFFSKDLTTKLPKYIGINDHTIDLIEGH